MPEDFSNSAKLNEEAQQSRVDGMKQSGNGKGTAYQSDSDMKSGEFPPFPDATIVSDRKGKCVRYIVKIK